MRPLRDAVLTAFSHIGQFRTGDLASRMNRETTRIISNVHHSHIGPHANADWNAHESLPSIFLATFLRSSVVGLRSSTDTSFFIRTPCISRSTKKLKFYGFAPLSILSSIGSSSASSRHLTHCSLNRILPNTSDHRLRKVRHLFLLFQMTTIEIGVSPWKKSRVTRRTRMK